MKRVRALNRKRRGFTIIEAVIAIVILAIAIPPMLWSLRQAHSNRVDPIMASQARWLATERIEDVIADRHSTTRGYGFLAAANYPDEPAGTIPDFPAFARFVHILETGADLTAPAPGGGYKTITVRIEWTVAGGAARELTIATVVTEY